MNVNVVHLAEFHGDGHPQDPGPVRLPELRGDVRRVPAALRRFGSLVPPRRGGQRPRSAPRRGPRAGPLALPLPPARLLDDEACRRVSRSREDDPKYGTVYHVGDPDDMLRLLEDRARPGLDGAPADQGVELDPRRLPRRALLPVRPLARRAPGRRCPPTCRSPGWARACSTCSTTWPTGAPKKYVPGEVDVFKIDHTHELYGHMNVNYLQLDRAPRFDDDWTPVLDALRARPVLRHDGRGLARPSFPSAARRAARP